MSCTLNLGSTESMNYIVLYLCPGSEVSLSVTVVLYITSNGAHIHCDITLSQLL